MQGCRCRGKCKDCVNTGLYVEGYLCCGVWEEVWVVMCVQLCYIQGCIHRAVVEGCEQVFVCAEECAGVYIQDCVVRGA